MSYAPTIEGESAVFSLATGEKVRVSIREGALGLIGYHVNINTDRGLLVVVPSSGNCIDVMTERSLVTQRKEIERVVRERDAAKATKEQ